MDIKELKEIFTPYGFKAAKKNGVPVFLRKVASKDPLNRFAFTTVIATVEQFTLCIQGYNEPLLVRGVQTGVFKVEEPEDIEQYFEILLEVDDEEFDRLRTVLPFLALQLQVLEQVDKHDERYEDAIANIELLVNAANDVVM